MVLIVVQGDGTAFIFRDKPEVFTLSVHGEGNFPTRKQTSDLDVPLSDGTGDNEFLRHASPTMKHYLPEHLCAAVVRKRSISSV